jgi:hypothetical protein
MANQSVYGDGNYLDDDRDGHFGGGELPVGGGATALPSPWAPSTAGIPTETAAAAYPDVLAHAGAFPRDQVDAQVLADVASLGTAGDLWTHQAATGLGNGGYGEIGGGAAPLDTDRDGMPDAWELRYGLDPHDPSDVAGDFDHSGYPNVAKYLDGLIDGRYR